MAHTITTVAFDYGGVLANMIDDSIIHHMADSAGTSFEELRTSIWKFRSEYDQGILDADTYWKRVIEHTGAQCPADSFDQNEMLDTLKHLDAIAYISFNPGILRWIRTLRAHNYRCIIISNMAGEMYDLLLKGTFLEHYFERVILSGWIHVNKPDPRIFEEAIHQMQVPADEILFLDDLPHNVEGARNVGLHSIQFTDTLSLEKRLAAEYPDLPRRGLVCPL